jgi:tripartite-type tricarboxylate transporter receptor subunit TctC
VPAPPGTLLDAVPRLLAEKLAARWGQPVIIENRPGAGQRLGAEVVARAEPDGYTLLATPPGPLAVSQWFFPKLGFDPSAFVPVSVMVTVPNVLVVNPGIAATNLEGFIGYAKANPGKLNYGSPGLGSTPHLAQEQLMRASGIRLVHVPYQGMAPALNDLLAGHIQVMITNVGNCLPYIEDGKLKAIAVTGDRRMSELPDVPAAAELLKDFAYFDWFAIVAPPKTPLEIAARLSQSISEALQLPEVAQRLRELTIIPVGASPERTAQIIKQDSERWRQVIAAAGLNKPQ